MSSALKILNINQESISKFNFSPIGFGIKLMHFVLEPFINKLIKIFLNPSYLLLRCLVKALFVLFFYFKKILSGIHFTQKRLSFHVFGSMGYQFKSNCAKNNFS